MQGNLTALLITASIIFIVVVIGFAAGRDKSSRQSVEEWSVGGRKFGGSLRLVPRWCRFIYSLYLFRAH